jgi:hypothetical protein
MMTVEKIDAKEYFWREFIPQEFDAARSEKEDRPRLRRSVTTT